MSSDVAPHPMLPRGPVLDWSSLLGPKQTSLPAVDQAPSRLLTTSGRAALALALQALQLPAKATVLVPTYHCPTMVAPIVYAGLTPVFYALGEDALPRVAALDRHSADTPRAIIVAHFFGLPRSLASVRRWCDAHGVALIEDCAHSFFGKAGERPVGAWGDFATASLTKFFPVSEAGLLASASRAMPQLPLTGQGWRAQAKGAVDVLETATRAGRLRGARSALRGLFALKNQGKSATRPPLDLDPVAVSDELQGCDMSRTSMSPVTVARWAYGHLPRARMGALRQANFQRLKDSVANAPRCRVLFDAAPTDAPYALPLWVDDADRVYHGLRTSGMPVFRWDQLWAGTPCLAGDEGGRWSRHVLQLLCHQDLTDAEVALMGSTLRRLL